MGTATGSVFVFQEVCLFFLGVRFQKVFINTSLAALKAASAGKLCIDFIIGDEIANNRHIHHVCLILSARKFQIFQLRHDTVELMEVESHHTMVLFVNIQELCELLRQNRTELRVCKLFRQLCCFIRKTAELISMENIQVIAFTTFLAQITVEIPKRYSKLITLVLGSFGKFYIGSEFALLQKLSDTLDSFRPRNDLGSLGVSCRTSHCQMNTIFGIPRRNAAPILLDTIAAVVSFFQKLSQFINKFLFHKLSSDCHTAVGAVAAQHQEMVNFFLGKRKSRELSALCFIYQFDLFIFGEEKVETQLLISSVITTSSACAFRLFMCCTQPI